MSPDMAMGPTETLAAGCTLLALLLLPAIPLAWRRLRDAWRDLRRPLP